MKNIKNTWFYIKNFRKSSLFWRTFFIIILLMLLPFIIMSMVFYSNTLNTIENEIVFENSSMLDGAKNIIDDTISECDMLGSYIANNINAQDYMLGDVSSEVFEELCTLAKTIPLIYKYIDSVYIYSDKNKTVYAGDSLISLSALTDSNWENAYRNLSDRRGIIFLRKKNNAYPSLISVIKPVYVSNEKLGAVIININSQSLYNSMASDRYNSGQSLFVVDTQNRIILSENISYFNKTPEEIDYFPKDFSLSDHIKKKTVNKEKSIVISEKSKQFGFTYISIYPMTLSERQFFKMRVQIIFISVIMLILGFVLSYVASAKSYEPLKEIISFLDTTTPSYAPAESSVTNDELKYIINSIRTHIEDKKKMSEILEARVTMLKSAQYEMLQAQINPHFLYNTLETINWMAYGLSNSENPVSKSLMSLSGFFRNTLSSSGYLISIENEIKYTKDYIDILNLRYQGLFDIVWDISDDIMSCTIIKICLQPIIENAVYHGFKPKGSKGLLKITGRAEKDNIVITASDDGTGMDKDALELLNNRLRADEYLVERGHIGLMNVNKRIKIIFGNDYGISVRSEKDVGTDVIITIPKTNG